MPKFKVVSGKHHQRQADGSEKTFHKGDVVEMTVAEANKFVNKFAPVIQDQPAEEVVKQPVLPVSPKLPVPVQGAPKPPIK